MRYCGWCERRIYYGLYCSNDCAFADYELMKLMGWLDSS